MPSLPTSDGLKNPVHSSGLSSKICNPRNQLLDRSVSAPASAGSHKSSLAEKIDPGAVKSLESSAECQITPEKDHSHLLHSLADHASSADNDQQTGEAACHGPNISSQNTLEKTAAADSLKEKNTKARSHDLESPLEVTREDMPDTSMCAQQTVSALPLPSEQLELNQMNELPLHLQRYEPVNERHLEKQNEPTDPEYPCNIGGLELPALGEQGLTNIQPESLADSLAEKRGHGLEKVGLSLERENAQMSASCSCTLTETFMEIDVGEQPTTEVRGLSREQSAQTENISASGLNIDCPLMEMDSSKQESSLSEPLSNPFAASDLLSPESNVEMTGMCNEFSNSVAEKSSSSSGICQLHTDPAASAEEPSLSLASALKELHELLIINCKGDSKSLAPEEDACQLAKVPEEQVQWEELSKDEHGNVGPDGQDLNGSFHQERFEPINSERPAEEPPCPDETENMSVQFFHPSQTAVERDALEIQTSPSTSDSVILSSVATSNQVHMEQAEIGPERSLNDQHPTNQTLAKNKSFLPELMVGEDVPPNLFPGMPGVTDSSTSTEDLRPPHQIIEPPPHPPVSYPELSSIVPPPSLFPAADINQILCAGFTLQEALEALERAGGNADLALLSLLAKNIRVPT